MKKFEFYLNFGIPGTKSNIEIIEFDNNVTEEEVNEIFSEWVFNQLDSGYREL